MFRHLLNILIISTFACLAVPFPARADNLEIRNSDQLLSLFEKAKPYEPQAARLVGLAPVQIRTRIAGLGRFTGTLSKRRTKNWQSWFSGEGGKRTEDKSKLLLLRGTFRLGRSTPELRPFAASVFEVAGKPQLKINFLFQRPGRSITRHYEIRASLKNRGKNYSARVRSVPSTYTKKRMCSTAAAPVSAAGGGFRTEAASADFPLAAASLRIVEIATEGDYNWYSIFGQTSNSQISSTINLAETIYENEVSLTFKIQTQTVITLSASNYTPTEAFALLEAFRTRETAQNHLGSADSNFLFTGRDLDGFTIGIAYMVDIPGDNDAGVVCYEPAYSYGVVQRDSAPIDFLTLAHELGHTFGADHDNSSPATIMNAVAASNQTTFSTYSRSEITSHVAVNGGCLAVATPTPTPIPGAGATSTPGPSPTPTGIPTATPTGTGGGGGGDIPGGTNPGELPDLPIINLSAKLNKGGLFSSTFSLSGGTQRGACALTLQISKGKNFSSAPYSVNVAGGAATSAQLSFTLALKMLATKIDKGKVLLRAAYICSDDNTASYSSQVVIKPSGVRAAKVVPLKGYVKKLAGAATKSLTPQTPAPAAR